MERQNLNELTNLVGVLVSNRVLIQVYKKAIILEINCLKSSDHNIRQVGYDSQDLQKRIEHILL